MRLAVPLLLVAAVLLLTAPSPSPKPSPGGTNNYYYSGNWYYGMPSGSPSRSSDQQPIPAEAKGGKTSNLDNNRPNQDKAPSESATASAKSLSATKPDQTQAARESNPAAPVTPRINVHVHVDSHDTVVAWATVALAAVGLLQVFLLIYTYKASKQNADAARDNATAAQKQAATLEKTLIETGKAADAAKESADVLINSESPYLEIIKIELSPATFFVDDTTGTLLPDDTEISNK